MEEAGPSAGPGVMTPEQKDIAERLQTADRKEVVELLNKRVDKLLVPGAPTTWFTVFKEIDSDFSGMLTFDELKSGVRERLRITTAELPQKKLSSLWVSLDADNNGYVESSEFHKFMGQAEPPKDASRRRAALLEQKARTQRERLEAHAEHELHAEGFRSSESTQSIRDDLEARGIPPATDYEMKDFALSFGKWVKAYLPDAHQGIAWLKVFKEADNDASGLITFDEVRLVIRRTFKVKASEFSEDRIKVLWVALDYESSDAIEMVTFARFMKMQNIRTPATVPAPRKRSLDISSSPRLPYGEELRALLSPRKPSQRSPVKKLMPRQLDGSLLAAYDCPGPGKYSPTLTHTKERSTAWALGDRNSRRSAVEPTDRSPGPKYLLPDSLSFQSTSAKPTAPHFGFGTQSRDLSALPMTSSPGPGAYTPRLTTNGATSWLQTVAAGQLTEGTTPMRSTQMVYGTWSRKADRELERVRLQHSLIQPTF